MAYTFNQANIVTFDSKGNTLLPNGLTVLGLASAGFVKTDANGRFFIDTGGAVGQTANALTFNNSGSGSASGVTFNGATAVTISYNSIGAQPLSTNLTSLAGLTYTTAAFIKMTAAGTFVLDTSGGTQTLQQVTTAGNDTTNTIILKNPTDPTKFFEIRVLSNGNLLFDSSGTASLHCTGDIVAFSDGTGGSTGTGSGSGAGHVIAKLLVPFTQRETLSFSGVFNVTDDAANNATLVDFNTAGLSIPTSQLTGLNLQAVTDGGNITNDPIVLTNTAGTSQVSISVDSNGDVILTAGTNKNFHFSGDVIAFSSATPPPSTWWDSLPIATASTLGGIKVGTGLTIDGSGVLSIGGGVVGQTTNAITFTNNNLIADSPGITFNGSVARTVSYNTIGAAAASHTHATSDITGLDTSLADKLSGTSDAGNIAYWTAAKVLSGDARFFWDSTSKKLRIQSPDQSKQFTIEIGNDGNIVFTGGTNQNFHFSGDVVAFSALTPPVSTWWDSLPIATASTLGGIKIGSGLSIDGSGIVSVTGGSSAIWGNITGTLSNQTDLWNALNGKASSVHTHTISDVTGLQTALDGKEPTLTKGNLTELTSSVLTISGGTNAVIGSGTSIEVKQASGSQSGYLSSSDWTTFNNKQNALTNPVTGTGTQNYIAKFSTTGSILTNSQIRDDGTGVAIGGAPSAYKLDITGTLRASTSVTSPIFTHTSSVVFTAPDGQALSTTLKTGATTGFDTAGALLIYTGTAASAASGSISIYSGASAGAVSGNVNIYTSIGGIAGTSSAAPSGTINIYTGNGGAPTRSNGATAGPLNIYTGNGGVGNPFSSNTSNGGAGGALTIYSGNGATATGGGNAYGGAGGSLIIRSGNGGNAVLGTGSIASGGNSGDITLVTGTPGTGTTVNGTSGSIYLKVNTSTTVLTVSDSAYKFDVSGTTRITGNTTISDSTATITNGANQVVISVDANGNVIFTAGTNQNFHFSGDVIAFSSLTPPAGSWWDSLPIATASTLGGIKIGSGLAIDGSGVLSVTGAGVGSVTSVGLAAPTGFTVTNSPVTSSGTLTLSYTSGYSLPTTASQTNWDTAFGWGNHATAGYQLTSQKGVANGYASLDSGGKVPVSQLPSSLMEYKGVWNASTNSPSLIDGTGDTGDVYRVSVAGTRNLGSGNISFEVGDYVIYNGTTWEKSDTTDAVASVNGQTGVITLTTTNIGEGTNLYFTEARVRSTPLTGYAVGTNTALTATDSVLTAFQNVQGQINAIKTGTLAQFAATTSAQLAGVISDETGSGVLVFATSPALTGTPTSTTAAVDTNTTQIATTAFVLAQASASNPLALGSVAIGTSTRYARADHVHPTTGLGLTSGTLAQFSATTSAQLASVISDETGTGALVFATTPTFTNSYVIQNGANSVTVSVNANGDVIFTAGTNKNFHFSGDVVAFSSLTPPAANWWDSLPYATTTTVGGVKVDGTSIVINGSGVISAVGGGGSGTVNLYTDYDNTIAGSRNSVNTVFQTSFNFVSGSTRVFVNGLRYSKGASYDYQETAANQITFTTAPDLGDLIVIDYIKV
jgi:hypothetical protein